MISIHAPTKGATLSLSEWQSLRIFQSTLPRRERLIKHTVEVIEVMISIHAPTKGATLCHLFKNLAIIYFNPRSHEGSDAKIQP